MKLKVKKGSTVKVITGSDKGKTGKVLDVNSSTMEIKVQGVRVQTHFEREEGLTKKEGYIHYSNVKLIEEAPPKAAKKTKKKAAKKKEASASA